jgi:hydroxymethylpyrimidine/phosphomethylpyrimidine kinase
MSIEKDEVLGNLVRAVHILEASEAFASLIPEVRVNIVYALSNASKIEDVAAIDGRITLVKGKVRAVGYPRFGASDHMARLIIEVMKYDRSYRAGINFAWSPELSDFLKSYALEKGWSFAWIDRTKEPEEVMKVDGKSMPWKVQELLKAGRGKIPKIFYESAGWGKEPLFVLLGENAVKVALEVIDISEAWTKVIKRK